MKLKQDEEIAFKKMIETIDLRFVSGNDVPVERASVRTHEWVELKRIIAVLQSKKECKCP